MLKANIYLHFFSFSLFEIIHIVKVKFWWFCNIIKVLPVVQMLWWRRLPAPDRVVGPSRKERAEVSKKRHKQPKIQFLHIPAWGEWLRVFLMLLFNMFLDCLNCSQDLLSLLRLWRPKSNFLYFILISLSVFHISINVT